MSACKNKKEQENILFYDEEFYYFEEPKEKTIIKESCVNSFKDNTFKESCDNTFKDSSIKRVESFDSWIEENLLENEIIRAKCLNK